MPLLLLQLLGLLTSHHRLNQRRRRVADSDGYPGCWIEAEAYPGLARVAWRTVQDRRSRTANRHVNNTVHALRECCETGPCRFVCEFLPSPG